MGLKLKFGAEGLKLLPEIRKIDDVDVLYAIQEALSEVNTPVDLRRIYREDPTDPVATNNAPTSEAASPYTAQTPAEALPEDDDDQEGTP
jgi:hypothetical protein